MERKHFFLLNGVVSQVVVVEEGKRAVHNQKSGQHGLLTTFFSGGESAVQCVVKR